MGIRSFEGRVERLVEGTFARLFKSGLRPIEIARRITREMDGSVSVGVSGKPVASNDYFVYVSPDDLEVFNEVESTLTRELGDAAREHARDEGYTFMGPVNVRLVEAAGYPKGSFQIVGRLKEGSGGHGAGSVVLEDGDRVTLGDKAAMIGRLPENEITLSDPNVSRNHAEIRPHPGGYKLVDLGSTNGSRVNGSRVDEHDLQDGDELTFGTSTVTFNAS